MRAHRLQRSYRVITSDEAIRERQADLKTLIASAGDLFSGIFPSEGDLNRYVEKISAASVLIGCFLDERLLGFIATYCNDASTKKAFVTMVCVAPEARGGGVGEKLVNMAVDHVRKRGFDRIALKVLRINAPALRMYRKLGFLVVEENLDDVGLELAIIDRPDDAISPAIETSRSNEARNGD